MPQMAPILWLMLFFMFTLLFIMFNMMVYFIFKSNKYTMLKKLIIDQMNWKW
uniref:ATP synthase F0 subunit 8 n=1 Tax=Peuceptyelus minutus TaxID=2040463 RepID=A0A343KGM8_9HEMI|nr:ATP synthase F0 subunit 8 [Peuceptyelus minutus]